MPRAAMTATTIMMTVALSPFPAFFMLPMIAREHEVQMRNRPDRRRNPGKCGRTELRLR